MPADSSVTRPDARAGRLVASVPPKLWSSPIGRDLRLLGAVREAIAGLLTRHEAPQATNAVCAAVTELVGAVPRTAGGPDLQVIVACLDGHVRVEVADPSWSPPARQAAGTVLPETADPAFPDLPFVEAAAEAWGVRTDGSLVLWALLPT